ncbi:MAG: DNA repair protein RecO, partial [Cyclobacteriaceae bacterium]|nr:DNA repair protein RecO [Cyclobacteriaceae bacterium]
MIQKTQGVVLRFVRYGETSIVATIFTRSFGIQAYLVNGVRSERARTKIALFQPLTLVDMVVYHKENASMMRIKEIRCPNPCHSLHTDIRKESICMFLLEVLNRTLKEEAHSEDLYTFVEHAILTLDDQASGFENFHLIFMIKYSRYLGFGLQAASDLVGMGVFRSDEEPLAKALLLAEYDSPLSL